MHPEKYLFINPPVEDFSSSDHFALPYGMLAFMKKMIAAGVKFYFYDFLHRDFAYNNERYTWKKDHTGRYPERIIPKPALLQNTRRYFKRYGNSFASFQSYLHEHNIVLTAFTCIFINTDFTYHIPGVVAFIKKLTAFFNIKEEDIIIGGTPAWLMPGYFKQKLPCCRLFQYSRWHEAELKQRSVPWQTYPLGLYKRLDYIPFKITSGCPYQCSYCAAPFLSKLQKGKRFAALQDSKEIKKINRALHYFKDRFHTNIAIPLDDALLYNIQALKQLFYKKGFVLYSPNGLHIRKITEHNADILYNCGFKELRFGIETLNDKPDLQAAKLQNVAIMRKVELLHRAGFASGQIHFYLLYGLWGQTPDDVYRTIAFLRQTGCKINLSGYAPVPHTLMYDKFNRKYDSIFSEFPALTNNNTVHLWNELFTEKIINELKLSLSR